MWCAQLGCAVAIVLITYFKLSHITNFGVNLGQRARPEHFLHNPISPYCSCRVSVRMRGAVSSTMARGRS